MAKREFLQLSHDFNFKKHRPDNMLLSEKLDGQRCFWDGGLSTGLLSKDVPYANVEKDSKDHVSTGLWSRYGKVVHAPDWFIKALPPIPLDSELYTKRGDRQHCRSIVSRHIPDERWRGVTLRVFGSPPIRTVFADGVIDSQHFRKVFDGCEAWASRRAQICGVQQISSMLHFIDMYELLADVLSGNTVAILHPQVPLPLDYKEARTMVREELERVDSLGGEGLILQSKYTIWTPERSWNSLKVKKLRDAEAIVVGYTWGVEGKEGRLLGFMGSLMVEWKDNVFSIGGFKDAERQMKYIDGSSAYSLGCDSAGETVPVDVENPLFKRSSTVTFKYRDLTTDGLPVEAKYWRKL